MREKDELNRTEQELYDTIIEMINATDRSDWYKQLLINRIDNLIDSLLNN